MPEQARTETVKDCSAPWTWMVVLSDGTVKPCCYALGSLGNLNEGTIDEIWNGPVAIELRSFVLQDRIHPVCAGGACKFVKHTEAAREHPVTIVRKAA